MQTTIFKNKEAYVSVLYDKTYEDLIIKHNQNYKKREIVLDVILNFRLSSYKCYELIYDSDKTNKKCYAYSFLLGMFDSFECYTFIFFEKMTDDYIKELEKAFYNNALEFKEQKKNF